MMSMRDEQCRKVCRILDDVLANRPTERDALIVAVRTAFDEFKERKKGKWITDKYGNVICSECKWCAPRIMVGCITNRHLEYDKSDFCWNCGADMREDT